MKPGKTFANSDETILLTVSDDNYAAYLTFLENPDFIDENEILNLLKKANITHGYSAAINYNKQRNIKKEPGKPFLIAMGTNPNAKPEITLHFDRSKCFDPYSSFNVFEMEKFVAVEKGQPLADVSLALSSSSGKDIFGNEVTKFSKHDVSVYNFIGKDIKFDNEANQLIAMKSGYPYIDNTNKIQIKSDFYINEDIENAELNLYGDLIVNGVIYKSNLNIFGDLVVYGDIEDCINYGIFATGNISMDFAENSRLVSNGQIKFHNEVENCFLSATEGIWGEENSSVIGGLLQSENSISLYSVGSEQPVITEIEIALVTFTKELLKREEAYLNKLINNTSNKQNPDNRLIQQYQQKVKELEEKFTKQVQVALNSPPKRFKISVEKQVYSETLFRILNQSHRVKTPKGKMTFTLVNNELVINDIDKYV